MTAHLASLIAAHGTPLYIYSRERIIGALQNAQQSFPGFNVIYSVKANPYAPVLDTLRSYGAGIDAASRNEALACAALGFPSDIIYYSAPGKKERDIAACLNAAHIIADSFHELDMINAAARARGVIAEAGIRLNIPRAEMQASRFEVMGREASKFGVSLDEFIHRAGDIKKLSHVRVNGLHVYFGSQLLDAELTAANMITVSRAALTVDALFPLAYINYGGGFGVPYETEPAAPDASGCESGAPSIETDLDIAQTAALVLADGNTRQLAGKGVRLNLELGRYLVAQAGWYVSAVADVKKSGGVTFVILDGGMNAFFRPKFTGQTHRVSVWGKSETDKREKVRLVGNTCTPLDVFYETVYLPPVEPGDIVLFENAGAYGYSMSMLDFISLDKPAQVMV